MNRAKLTRGEFAERYGPTALVVGASEGIGAAFAEELAQMGLDLVLVARREEKLRTFADRTAGQFGVSCRAIPADMATEAGLQAVEAAVADNDVGLLVYNAALAPTGPFLDLTEDQMNGSVDVNCRAALRLCHAIARRVVEGRGAGAGRMGLPPTGGIVLVSSLTGLFGSPYFAAYAATKAYLIRLAESLEPELRPAGISTVVTCAGATATPAFLSAQGSKGNGGVMIMQPETVARGTLRRLPRGGRYIPGLFNQVSAALLGLFPPRVSARILGRAGRRTIQFPTKPE